MPIDVSNDNPQHVAQVNTVVPYLMLIGSQELMVERPTENKEFRGDSYTTKNGGYSLTLMLTVCKEFLIRENLQNYCIGYRDLLIWL